MEAENWTSKISIGGFKADQMARNKKTPQL
jgi:hypothetical protein